MLLSPQWRGQLSCQIHGGRAHTGSKQRSERLNSSETLALHSCGKHCGGWVRGVPWRDGRVEKPAVHLSPLNSSGFYITYPPSVLGCRLQLRINLPLSWKINQHVIADANIHAARPCSADRFGAPTGHRRDFLIVPTVCRVLRCYLGLQMASFVALLL